MLPLISPHPIDQQGSPCCGSLKWLSGRYDSKVNLVDPLDAEKLAEAGFLYVFNIGFPASLLCSIKLGHLQMQSALADKYLSPDEKESQ